MRASLVLLAAGCGGDADSARPQGPPAPVVEVAVVERGRVDEGLSLVGQLEADEVVMLRPETEGVVVEVAFDEGAEVVRGTVLFRLRDDWQRARLREAEAQVALTEQAWRRARTLAGEKILSGAELDQATANRDAARARLDVARIELERMTIRAPFDGVVGTRRVSPGDRVTAATDLVQIDAVATLKLAFPLPEPIVDWVKPGMTLAVSVAPHPGERFPGTVYFVAPALDPRNRQLLLKAHVPNPDRRLRPGLFATVKLDQAEPVEVVVVPESAVVYDPDGTYVWRLGADGAPTRAPVTLGQRTQGRVEVKTGLAAGDRIVSAGTNKVIPGLPVAVAGGDAAGAGS
ncbi:MAG: efflux RND transporter periplasmic adaptor subunit [bacterium]|nr:efflux RND transporter periplasmic adaptor subunit [bacterium]